DFIAASAPTSPRGGPRGDAPRPTNGELVTWINGTEVANFHPGAPNGYWDSVGNWRMRATSPPFTGFRWRDTTSLGLNWVKIQNFDAAPRVSFDDVIVATQRVGCNGQPARGPAPTPPAAPVLLP